MMFLFAIGPKIYFDDTNAKSSGWFVRAAGTVANHIFAQHTQFTETNGHSCDHTHVQIFSQSGFNFSFTTGD